MELSETMFNNPVPQMGRFASNPRFVNDRDRQIISFDDGIYDNIHSFRRDKYKSSFLASSFDGPNPLYSEELSARLSDAIAEAARYDMGMQCAKGNPEQSCGTHVYGHSNPFTRNIHVRAKNPQYNYANDKFSYTPGVYTKFNGFMKMRPEDRQDVL